MTWASANASAAPGSKVIRFRARSRAGSSGSSGVTRTRGSPSRSWAAMSAASPTTSRPPGAPASATCGLSITHEARALAGGQRVLLRRAAGRRSRPARGRGSGPRPRAAGRPRSRTAPARSRPPEAPADAPAPIVTSAIENRAPIAGAMSCTCSAPVHPGTGPGTWLSGAITAWSRRTVGPRARRASSPPPPASGVTSRPAGRVRGARALHGDAAQDRPHDPRRQALSDERRLAVAVLEVARWSCHGGVGRTIARSASAPGSSPPLAARPQPGGRRAAAGSATRTGAHAVGGPVGEDQRQRRSEPRRSRPTPRTCPPPPSAPAARASGPRPPGRPRRRHRGPTGPPARRPIVAAARTWPAAPMAAASSSSSTRWWGQTSQRGVNPRARAAATRSTPLGLETWTTWSAQPVSGRATAQADRRDLGLDRSRRDPVGHRPPVAGAARARPSPDPRRARRPAGRARRRAPCRGRSSSGGDTGNSLHRHSGT